MRRLPAVLIAITALSAAAIACADPVDAGRSPAKVRPAAPLQAKPFSLHDVRVIGGPFKQGQDIAVAWLLSLEPDRFLANFRKEAGLPPRAKHYGGWESQTISGHSAGHYLSACSLAWASTGNPEFRRRADYMVAELAACQAAHGDGYLAAFPNGRRVFAEIAAGNIRSSGFDLNGLWVPNYTLHKLFAGLRDAYRLTGNAQALEVARGLADWYERVFANLSEDQMQRVLACEHGGINETFADLYADTGDERYLRLSRRFHHRAILEPLAEGRDILPGKHANTQIPKLIGLAARYELAGDPRDRAAADFFWDRVVNHHSYVTGGHCDHEHFGPPDRLNDRLTTNTTETCNVYNMLKLTRYVFGWKPDARTADFYERALLNHIRSTQHPDGRVIYNLSLKPGHYKEYQPLRDAWTCCMGTGMENHVRYGDFIYFHDDAGLWVNLYIPSELDWRDLGVRVRLDTDWPYGDTAVVSVDCQEPREFTLRLRHPHWAEQGLIARVRSGEAPEAGDTYERSGDAAPGYLQITRVWRSGDRVEIRFPMSLRTESMPDNPDRIAIFYGPTLLAADLGPVNDPRADEPGFVPVLLTDRRPVRDWVIPVSVSELTFRTEGVGRPRDVALTPFFSLHDRRYTVYLDVFTEEGWAKKEAEIRAEREREAALAARTLDVLRIGEMQPERDHNLQGERTGAGEAFGRKWRHATDGGWFSFDMRVDPDRPVELICTYWGSDGGGYREFDILVDGAKIATQKLENNAPNRFFDAVYPIPANWTRGKSQVTIRFQAHPGKWAGGVFGVRTVRADGGK